MSTTAEGLRQQVRARYAEGEYAAGLAAAALEQVSVQLTHEVADGMHPAIVKAVKPGR